MSIPLFVASYPSIETGNRLTKPQAQQFIEGLQTRELTQQERRSLAKLSGSLEERMDAILTDSSQQSNNSPST